MSNPVRRDASWLAETLANQERRLALVESRKPMLAQSSIEDGAIDEYTQDGTFASSTGKQVDGSHVSMPFTGPKPTAPTAPILKAMPGAVEARWNGKFIGDEVSSLDFKHVALHTSLTPDVDVTPNTQVATIRGELGDVATLLAEEGMVYVCFVAWTAAGKASDPSPVSAVAVPASVDSEWLNDKLVEIDEKYDGVITEAGNLGTRLDTAEADLTAAAGRIADAEADLSDAFGQISTVDSRIASAKSQAATDAQTKADAAKAAAITAAALTAQAKADNAKSEALSGAATVAQQKADAAEAAALAAAKTYADVEASGAGAAALAAAKLDATAKADAAREAAKTAAALDAKAKADAAQAAAIAAAAITAQAKADAAQAAAIAAAKLDATAKADAAQQAAIDAAALVAQAKANAAQSAATTAAAADAKTKADAAQAAALAAAKTYADTEAAGAGAAALAAAKLDATTKADAAKAAAISAAAADATAKAAQAKTDATTIAANDATAKANDAQAAAIAAAATDATAKAGQAKTDAIASATAMTNGIGKNLSSAAAPTTFNTAPKGSMWRRTDSSGRIIGVWEQTGAGVAGTWTPRLITSETIDNLDVGKLSASGAAINTLVSQKIAAAAGQFIALDVGQLTVTGSSTMAEAVISKLWTDVVMSRKITTQMLAVGDFTNLIPNGIGDLGANAGWASSLIADATDKPAGVVSAFRSTPGQGTIQGGMDYWNVEPGAEYLTEFWLKADKPNSRLYLELRNEANQQGATNVSLDPTFSAGTYLLGNGLVPTVWTKYRAVSTMNLDTFKLRVGGMYFNHTNGTERNATVWIAGMTMKRRTGAVLIENGAVTAEKMETELVLTTDIIAGNPLGTHAKLNANGIRVMASTDGSTPTEVVRLGTDTDDYIGVVDPTTGNLSAAINSSGDISGQSLAIANQITLGGEDLGERINYMPQRLTAWAQVPINNSTMRLVTGQTEVGLYELGWDSDQGSMEARMYEFIMHEFMVMSSVNGIVGVRLRVTTDGSPPTVNSGLLGFNYTYCLANNYATLGMSRLVGSNNGNFVRVLVCLYNGTGGTVTLLNTAGQTHLFASVQDLGGTVAGQGQASLGGGPVGGTAVPPPVNPKVTVTKDFNATGTRSFIGSGATYAYNTGYMYSGLSPAGYGDLSSMATFPSFTSLLSGATVNDIWVYVYYDFWYQGSGGTAQISLHGQAALTSTRPAFNGAVTVANWPRASGKWVRLPDSTYAAFKSGGWKGIVLGGAGGGYERYGYAHDPKIRIRYTK